MTVWGTRTKRKPPDVSSAIASGTEFDANSLPIQVFVEGVSGSTTFRDAELRATYLPNDANDVVKVTVFEVTLTGFFGYGNEQTDNAAKFQVFGASSNRDGMISWDDANADGTKGDYDPNCQYFSNCMECQGTVKPSGVTNQVEFDFNRERWHRIWLKVSNGSWNLDVDETGSWRNDSTPGPRDDKSLNVSGSQHIYCIDAPRIMYRTRGWPPKSWDYMADILDLRQYALVNIGGSGYQCSDV